MNRIKRNISALVASFEVDIVTPYSDGDIIEAVKELEFAAMHGLHAADIVGAAISNAAGLLVDMDLHFFRLAIAAAQTDNTAFAPSDADILNYLGSLSLTDHKSFSTNSVSLPAINQRPVPFELGVDADGKAGTSLYLVAQAKGDMTFIADDDLQITVYVKHGG